MNLTIKGGSPEEREAMIRGAARAQVFKVCADAVIVASVSGAFAITESYWLIPMIAMALVFSLLRGLE